VKGQPITEKDDDQEAVVHSRLSEHAHSKILSNVADRRVPVLHSLHFDFVSVQFHTTMENLMRG
jgi:hypothetical protein